MDKVLIHTFFPSQDIKQNALLSSYLDSWWSPLTLRFIFDEPLKQWLRGEKEE